MKTRNLIIAGLIAATASMALYADSDDRYERGEHRDRGSYYSDDDDRRGHRDSDRGYYRDSDDDRRGYRDDDDRKRYRDRRDDDDRYRDRRHHDDNRGRYSSSGLQPIDPLYQKECGSCHFPYQPGLLPTRSWTKMMTNLQDHFGTDATLEPEDNKKITDYLTQYAGDTPNAEYKYYRKINRDIYEDETPLRISETRYFKKEHRKLTDKEIKQKEVKSLSHCQKCHTTADKGIYSERDIIIPNFGRWED